MRDVNRMHKKLTNAWERDVKHQNTTSLDWSVTPQTDICVAILCCYNQVQNNKC
jgi:hypothetical protein